MNDLLLKATPELLTGWCGPVVHRGEPCNVDGVGAQQFYPLYGHPTEDDAESEDIYLDLSRAECRDRVARVLAGVLYPDEPDIERMTGVSSPWWLDWAGHIPALSTLLDPNDDARLADGSRRVDAMALLLVAREVIGEDEDDEDDEDCEPDPTGAYSVRL